MSALKYVSDPFLHRIAPVREPDGSDEFGYGNKIMTDRVVSFDNGVTWLRVYAIRWGSAGSAYVLREAGREFFRECDFMAMKMPRGAK